MDPFVTIDDFAAYAGVGVTDVDIDQALLAVAAACQAIRTYTNQTLNLVEEDELTVNGNGHQTLLLPELPVWAIHSVEIDGEEVDDWHLSEAGVLYRTEGLWPRGVGNIAVVYSHGWQLDHSDDSPGVDADPMPSDLKMVALRIASTLSGEVRFDGVRQITLGDFSATFASEAAGLIEAPMKLILDRYTVKGAA